MSAIATMPRSPSHSGSAIWLRQLLGRRGTSRTIRPAAQARGASSSCVGAAGVADVRIGQRDQLARVGRVGQDFLVAGHGGVEHHFADRQAGGAHGNALEHGAVFEGEDCGFCHGFRLRRVAEHRRSGGNRSGGERNQASGNDTDAATPAPDVWQDGVGQLFVQVIRAGRAGGARRAATPPDPAPHGLRPGRRHRGCRRGGPARSAHPPS